MFNRPLDQTGSILGIWRLGEKLATGRGTVLYAAQPADCQGNPRYDYALKTVDASQENSSATRDATRQIVQSIHAAGVHHPNLVAILDASHSEHSPYLVMPRLDAQPLNVRIAQMEHFAVPVALWWIRQIAQALEKLHCAGWVHGDLKPENVLVDGKGHVTVIDLGFAARIHTPLHRVFRGTPDYASPELMSGASAALPAMDMFALGRVLWECLSQTAPIHSAGIEPVAELIERMISPEPSHRPSSAKIVQQLLSLEIETLGGHIGPSAATIRRAA
ncbi:serine/threonine protein kinase [Neorhodopirellula pilleata]|uniref:Serine/threonine-protein kinase PknA n=1 Tax=Neorhodopirellula pilleata TaxID=2714738 RepID=A0A5C6AIN0_9BACT|nr:protein kinase family protein [Neorhodopirellula pilleata]TWT98921.1 Serine/threonine-protein kinase PknA [Neorhodopirellula pilleata]